MNPFEFVIVLIIIVSIVRVIRYRMGDSTAFDRPRFHRRDRMGLMGSEAADPETERLRDEVKQLKERLHVLERIAVDKENTLSRQIEQLRDRPDPR